MHVMSGMVVDLLESEEMQGAPTQHQTPPFFTQPTHHTPSSFTTRVPLQHQAPYMTQAPPYMTQPPPGQESSSTSHDYQPNYHQLE